MGSRYLVFKVFRIIDRLSQNWRVLSSRARLTAPVPEGRMFKDGVLQRQEMLDLAGATSQRSVPWEALPQHLTGRV